MNTFSKIRQTIVQGNVLDAIKTLEFVAERSSLNEIHLLSFQYNKWKKDESLGLNPNEVILNRIIYGLLELCSKIELESSKGLSYFNAKISSKYEKNIKEGYQFIIDKSKHDKVDDFLGVLLAKNPSFIQELIEVSKEGWSNNFKLKFITLIKQIKSKDKLISIVEETDLVQEFKKLIENDKYFLVKWLHERLKIEKQIIQINNELKNYTSKYNSFWNGGVLGFLSGIIFSILNLDINQIMKDIGENENFDDD